MPPAVWYLLAGLVAVGGALYWLLITTEGTYLGVRAVAWLYDLTAKRYDRIKGVHYLYEQRFIGQPLAEALERAPDWRLLDIACGTGRVAQALEGAAATQGLLIGVDRSPGMLAAAIQAGEQLDLSTAYALQNAERLGFHNNTFEGITCLEALEFMPDGRAVLSEMRRVLMPGGVLLISNRIAPDAWFYPGRLCGRGRLEHALEQAGFIDIRSQSWQTYYDLIWARKPEPLLSDKTG